MIIIGSLIIVYDYPQLEYLKNLEEEQITGSDESIRLQDRLQIEFTIGIIVLISGMVLGLYGIIKKVKGS